MTEARSLKPGMRVPFMEKGGWIMLRPTVPGCDLDA